MPIDYSKWDKIELSDDSDIEVHPNVDKRSFIRWKQQDIHQKRIQRNHDIQTFEIQIPMYEELNKRVNKLLSDNSDSKLSNFDGIKSYLSSTFDDSKPKGVEEDGPTYNEMIEDLFVQLKEQLEKNSQDPNDGTLLRFQIVNHVKKIDEVLAQQHEKLKELYQERKLHISSEDIHTGFDRSFLNKAETKTSTDSSTSEPSSTKPTAETSTTASSYSASATYTAPSTELTKNTSPKVAEVNDLIELKPPSVNQVETQSEVSTKEEEELGLAEVHPDTFALSKFSTNAVPEFTQFLKSHTYIINTSQKDALLMKAFDAQFAGDYKRVEQIVFFATLLQYIYDIIHYKNAKHPAEISIIVDQFSSKLFGNNNNNPLLSSFVTEVNNTTKHIETRCKVLAQESVESGEGVETIQLKSLDDNSKLVVNLPDPNSEYPEEVERYKIFETLPVQMQDALKTESLDEVNKVFESLPMEQSEEILEIFEKADIIGLQAVLENEQDWNELKDEYSKAQQKDVNIEQGQEIKIQELNIEDHGNSFVETGDIVD